eukprot:TRINITY_DN49161_c0_g1_i1.p1 TRINITY_DN49161_c0_g1~~TRINITY_DN49161_c0_g1_i1.p1  ORF type:complete len:574 (-),score=48.67 TRINITY_DN49161_c0_g1_i1:63-1784(-)
MFFGCPCPAGSIRVWRGATVVPQLLTCDDYPTGIEGLEMALRCIRSGAGAEEVTRILNNVYGSFFIVATTPEAWKEDTDISRLACTCEELSDTWLKAENQHQAEHCLLAALNLCRCLNHPKPRQVAVLKGKLANLLAQVEEYTVAKMYMRSCIATMEPILQQAERTPNKNTDELKRLKEDMAVTYYNAGRMFGKAGGSVSSWNVAVSFLSSALGMYTELWGNQDTNTRTSDVWLSLQQAETIQAKAQRLSDAFPTKQQLSITTHNNETNNNASMHISTAAHHHHDDDPVVSDDAHSALGCLPLSSSSIVDCWVDLPFKQRRPESQKQHQKGNPQHYHRRSHKQLAMVVQPIWEHKQQKPGGDGNGQTTATSDSGSSSVIVGHELLVLQEQHGVAVPWVLISGPFVDHVDDDAHQCWLCQGPLHSFGLFCLEYTNNTIQEAFCCVNCTRTTLQELYEESVLDWPASVYSLWCSVFVGCGSLPVVYRSGFAEAYLDGGKQRALHELNQKNVSHNYVACLEDTMCEVWERSNLSPQQLPKPLHYLHRNHTNQHMDEPQHQQEIAPVAADDDALTGW